MHLCSQCNTVSAYNIGMYLYCTCVLDERPEGGKKEEGDEGDDEGEEEGEDETEGDGEGEGEDDREGVSESRRRRRDEESSERSVNEGAYIHMLYVFTIVHNVF